MKNSLRSTWIEAEKKDYLNEAAEDSKVVIESAIEKSDISLLNPKVDDKDPQPRTNMAP